jgi:hypothetical protein
MMSRQQGDVEDRMHAHCTWELESVSLGSDSCFDFERSKTLFRQFWTGSVGDNVCVFEPTDLSAAGIE